jgi:ferredoxin
MPKVKFINLEGKEYHLDVKPGVNLRVALIDHNLSPYTNFTQKLNCGGNGICATCGVWIEDGAPEPRHWHDKAAQRFGYPRLSCQINVKEDMIARQVTKWIWGGRRKAE